MGQSNQLWRSLAELRQDASKLDVLFIVDSDPLFTVPSSYKLEDTLKQIDDIVTINPFPTATDRIANYVLPSHHYLESWGDEQPVNGFWSTRQPAVRPLTDSSS